MVKHKKNILLNRLKGLSIFLLVWSMCIKLLIPMNVSAYNNLFYKILSTISLPLLMIICGYSFYKSISKNRFIDEIKGKLRTLLFPFLLLGFLLGLILSIFISSTAQECMISMLNGFCAIDLLLILFVLSILVGFINKYLNDSIYVYLLLFIIPLFIPYFAKFFYMYQFFMIGYFYSKGNFKLSKNNDIRLLIASIIFYSFLLLFFDRSSYIETSGLFLFNIRYNNMLLICIYRFVISLLGSNICILLFSLFLNKEIKYDFLEKVGSKTITIFVWSMFLTNIISIIIKPNITNMLLYSLFTLFISIIITVISYYFNKLISKNSFMCEVFGKKEL